MKRAAILSALVALALAACNVVLGPLNQDEGWYLLAGVNTASGMLPYRDYMFSQGPVLPFVYAALSPLWAPFGVLGGRVLTCLFGLAAAAFCAGLAWRLADARVRGLAALLAWLLVACCPVYSYFTAIPKTYGLSALFVMAAFFVLAGRRPWRFELAGVLLALACGTRVSLGALLAVVGFGLLFMRRRDGMRWAWFRFGLGGGLMLAAVFAPFIIMCGENFAFAQTMHASRSGSGFMQWLMLRAGSASRLVQGYFLLPLALALPLALPGRRDRARVGAVVWLALAGWLAVTAVHYMAPFPYDDYQTPVMPLLAAAAAALFANAVAGWERCHTRIAWIALVMAVLFMGSSPLCMTWVSIRQDRFWVEMKEKPDLIKLREVGRFVRDNTHEDDVLLTQDAYIAVEAGRRVLAGLEMGPFSIYPEMGDSEVSKLKVHNIGTLEKAIEESAAPIAALSGYAFALSSPAMGKLAPEHADALNAAVDRKYEEISVVKDFGQQHTTLRLLRRKGVDDASPAPLP